MRANSIDKDLRDFARKHGGGYENGTQKGIKGSRMKRKLSRQQANVIMKAALVALIEATKERRISYGLPHTMTTEDIREVFQCMPEFDKEYHDARRVITNAADLLRGDRANGR